MVWKALRALPGDWQGFFISINQHVFLSGFFGLPSFSDSKQATIEISIKMLAEALAHTAQLVGALFHTPNGGGVFLVRAHT